MIRPASLPATALWCLILLGLAACDTPPSGSAAACAFDKVAAFPVHLSQNRVLADVAFDGKPAILLLDTGSSGTLLTQAAAERLALPPNMSEVMRISGIGGSSFAHPVKAQTFAVGSLALPERTVPVGPFTIPTRAGITPDGFLGTDILGLYDVDIDLPARKVTLYRSRDCPNGPPPWQPPPMRLAAPPGAPGLGYAFVPAEVDGHPITAFLDTGADFTAIDSAAALRLGITQAQLDQDRAISLNGAVPFRTASHVHRVQSLRIGDDGFHDRPVLITAMPQDTTGMLIGMDYLRTRRIWISLRSRVSFISRDPAAPAIARN